MVDHIRNYGMSRIETLSKRSAQKGGAHSPRDHFSKSNRRRIFKNRKEQAASLYRLYGENR